MLTHWAPVLIPVAPHLGLQMVLGPRAVALLAFGLILAGVVGIRERHRPS